MLVLSRRPGESITIGDDIVVHVHRIGRGRVSLAIDAPRHVPVVRTEVTDHTAVAALVGETSSAIPGSPR